jgi:hypothetical protein
MYMYKVYAEGIELLHNRCRLHYAHLYEKYVLVLNPNLRPRK